jgi:hypothetical protein
MVVCCCEGQTRFLTDHVLDDRREGLSVCKWTKMTILFCGLRQFRDFLSSSEVIACGTVVLCGPDFVFDRSFI